MQNNIDDPSGNVDDVMVVLYSTEGCHLCEEALLLINNAGFAERVAVIDIIEHESLVAAYGESIPVLHHLPSNTALFWPFTAQQIIEFFEEHHGSSQN